MDFNDTPEEAKFRAELRAWLEKNLPEGWGGDEPELPEPDDVFSFHVDWQRKLYEAGYVGLNWPKEYGGRGATLMEQVIWNEEMIRARAPRLINIIALSMIGPTIVACGTEEQKERFLRPMLSAEEIWCQGFSEPNAGSDLASLQCRAVLDGDDFVVNGQKIWTTIAFESSWCELLVRTDTSGSKHQGITCLIVDMKSPGVTVKPLVTMSGDRIFNEIFFEDARVPIKNALGKVGDGWNVAITTLMHERSTLSLSAALTYQISLQSLIALARKTKRNGGTAYDDPLIRQKIAQCAIDLEGNRLNLYRSLTKVLKGGVPGPEGSTAKLLGTETYQQIQEIAMEIQGPYAQMVKGSERAVRSGIWQNRFLSSRGDTIAAGTSEIMKNIIGERVLGLPKS